jgi:hypothetical protein
MQLAATQRRNVGRSITRDLEPVLLSEEVAASKGADRGRELESLRFCGQHSAGSCQPLAASRRGRRLEGCPAHLAPRSRCEG